MATVTLSHALTRSHRLRALIDQERRRASGPRLRLLRLQRLLLKAQMRLAAVIATPAALSLHGYPA